MNESIEPKLAAPGAGLPKHELFVGRLIFTWKLWTGDRDSFTARFQRERERIRALVEGCKGETGGQRVLIRRPPGLEDSSRYWSVWMTLEHLEIVHHSMIRVIRALTSGIVPEGKASTAAVKPSPQANATAVDKYERSCDELLGTVAAAGNLKTKVRYAHPWFGPLNAGGWHAMAAGHMGIHRVQIERIRAGLGN